MTISPLTLTVVIACVAGVVCLVVGIFIGFQRGVAAGRLLSEMDRRKVYAQFQPRERE